ncbi:unnamed protein product [Citrullus colocynthis]|uniref:Uncharacterized protein n=1 Tax=Citrullus colocynthis TaxID=252529 RepID=A0ABP0YUM2_9ROSI
MRPTGRTETKVGHSDPGVPCGRALTQRIKDNGSFLCRAEECAGSEAQNLALASRPTVAPAHRNPAVQPPQAEISQEYLWTELEQPLMLDHERRLELKDRLYFHFIGKNDEAALVDFRDLIEKQMNVEKKREIGI